MYNRVGSFLFGTSQAMQGTAVVLHHSFAAILRLRNLVCTADVLTNTCFVEIHTIKQIYQIYYNNVFS
jgi:hypothetical protein